MSRSSASSHLDAARGRIRGRDIRQSEHGTQQGHRVVRIACVVEQPNEMLCLPKI